VKEGIMRMHLKRILATAAIAAALAAAFAAYLRPDFMLELANRIMLCA
jgi:hypothetical protein